MRSKRRSPTRAAAATACSRPKRPWAASATGPGVLASRCQTVERAALEHVLGEGAVHQGLALAVAPLSKVALDRACAPAPGRNLVLVLDQINDPHNLGAILRSAVAFGARAVVVPERRSGELGGAAAKAASGALDLVPVVEVVNLARALDELAALGYWRLALDAQADATIEACPRSTTWPWCSAPRGPASAAWFASIATSRPACRSHPAMASLNVSVAAGIALYALARRRGHG